MLLNKQHAFINLLRLPCIEYLGIFFVFFLFIKLHQLHQLHLLSLSILLILLDDILEYLVNRRLLILSPKVCQEVNANVLDSSVVFISLSQCLLIYDFLSGPWLFYIIEEKFVKAHLLRISKDFLKFPIKTRLCLRVSNHCDFFIGEDQSFTIYDASDREEGRLLIEKECVVYDITLAEVFNFEFTVTESGIDLCYTFDQDHHRVRNIPRRLDHGAFLESFDFKVED